MNENVLNEHTAAAAADGRMETTIITKRSKNALCMWNGEGRRRGAKYVRCLSSFSPIEEAHERDGGRAWAWNGDGAHLGYPNSRTVEQSGTQSSKCHGMWTQLKPHARAARSLATASGRSEVTLAACALGGGRSERSTASPFVCRINNTLYPVCNNLNFRSGKNSRPTRNVARFSCDLLRGRRRRGSVRARRARFVRFARRIRPVKRIDEWAQRSARAHTDTRPPTIDDERQTSPAIAAATRIYCMPATAEEEQKAPHKVMNG